VILCGLWPHRREIAEQLASRSRSLDRRSRMDQAQKRGGRGRGIVVAAMRWPPSDETLLEAGITACLAGPGGHALPAMRQSLCRVLSCRRNCPACGLIAARLHERRLNASWLQAGANQELVSPMWRGGSHPRPATGPAPLGGCASWICLFPLQTRSGGIPAPVEDGAPTRGEPQRAAASPLGGTGGWGGAPAPKWCWCAFAPRAPQGRDPTAYPRATYQNREESKARSANPGGLSAPRPGPIAGLVMG